DGPESKNVSRATSPFTYTPLGSRYDSACDSIVAPAAFFVTSVLRLPSAKNVRVAVSDVFQPPAPFEWASALEAGSPIGVYELVSLASSLVAEVGPLSISCVSWSAVS